MSTSIHIESISESASDTINSKAFGMNGTVLLTSSSNYTGTSGQSPIGDYLGFTVGGSGVSISDISYNEQKHKVFQGEDLNDFGFVNGLFYSIDSIKQITISSGSILLYKKISY